MDNNNMNIKQTIQLLGIQDITTPRQKKNGTVTWKLPIKRWGKFIEVASFKSGYVRNNNCGYSNYQLNKCKNIIPQGRVNLGFKVCVDCSTTEQYGCAPLINHKTGNSIQIMSSSDAARISKMTQRRGYGTMLG